MADSHLGFSAYNKVDQWGRNLVEERVYEGFAQVIEKIIEDIKPDVLVHAGDVFHHVRPKIRTLYIFKRELEKLSKKGIPTIIISGNHDSPKTSSTASPFDLFEGLENIHIIHNNEYQAIPIGDHLFHCIPFCLNNGAYLEQFSKIEPSGSDVLVMHGLIESLRDKRLRTVGEHELSDSFLKSYFSYVALGHYHNQKQVAKNAWYSGSIEYFNFGEASDSKGILQIDLNSKKVEQIEIIQKYMIDFPPMDCSGLSSMELAEKLLILCDKEEIKDKIIRINLKNVSRATLKDIDRQKIAKLGSPALFFKINPEYIDEKDKSDVQLDSTRLDEAFAGFLEDKSIKDFMPKAIKEDVKVYGTNVMKKAISIHNTERLNASE